MLEFLRLVNDTLPPVPTEVILVGLWALLMLEPIVRRRAREIGLPTSTWPFWLMLTFWTIRVAGFLLAGK